MFASMMSRRRRVGRQLLGRVGDAIGRLLRPGDEPRQSVGTVLDLHDQIDGGEVDRRGLVGDHHDLGRSRERGRHANQAARCDLALGLGDPSTAGTRR